MCASHVPVTSFLFGYNLQTRLNDIRASNKISKTTVPEKYAKAKCVDVSSQLGEITIPALMAAKIEEIIFYPRVATGSNTHQNNLSSRRKSRRSGTRIGSKYCDTKGFTTKLRGKQFGTVFAQCDKLFHIKNKQFQSRPVIT
jgi:hypothetical protein